MRSRSQNFLSNINGCVFFTSQSQFFNPSNAPCSHIGLISIAHISSPSPFFSGPMSDTITAHILAPEAQTNRRTTQHNMHEIAYSECFKAWMVASVLYYRACEWINRIRAVVGLRWRPAAPAQHSITIQQAFLKTQRRQDWDQIEDSLLFILLLFIQGLARWWILLWRDVNLGQPETRREIWARLGSRLWSPPQRTFLRPLPNRW